jgi:general secretion pathway protein J
VKSSFGFTLLEILIALFIFTLLALMLATSFHAVIVSQSGVEKKAQRLRQLQMALLVFSRDIEQAIDRSIINSEGKTEAAFIGEPDRIRLTHTGFASSLSITRQSGLQRVAYVWQRDQKQFVKLMWPVLDQAPTTKTYARPLLAEVDQVRFQYLAADGRFYDYWPPKGSNGDMAQVLPRAVSIFFNIPGWGEVSQLYLIPVDFNDDHQTSQTTADEKS